MRKLLIWANLLLSSEQSLQWASVPGEVRSEIDDNGRHQLLQHHLVGGVRDPLGYNAYGELGFDSGE